MGVKEILEEAGFKSDDFPALCTVESGDLVEVSDLNGITPYFGYNLRNRYSLEEGFMYDPDHLYLESVVYRIVNGKIHKKLNKLELLNDYVSIKSNTLPVNRLPVIKAEKKAKDSRIELRPASKGRPPVMEPSPERPAISKAAPHNEVAQPQKRVLVKRIRPYTHKDLSPENAYRGMGKLDLVNKVLEGHWETLGEIMNGDMELYEALSASGITGIAEKRFAGRINRSLYSMVERMAKKEKRSAKDRPAPKAEGERLGYFSDIDFLLGRRPSKDRSEINYVKLPDKILKKLMNDVIKEGILPPEDHFLHIELLRRGLLEESDYDENIRLEPGNENIKEVLNHFGIRKPDGAAAKLIAEFFNSAYSAATREDSFSAEVISSRVKQYMEEKGIERKYEGFVRYAYEKGLEYFKERMDWTDTLILLEVPSCYRTKR